MLRRTLGRQSRARWVRKGRATSCKAIPRVGGGVLLRMHVVRHIARARGRGSRHSLPPVFVTLDRSQLLMSPLKLVASRNTGQAKQGPMGQEGSCHIMRRHTTRRWGSAAPDACCTAHRKGERQGVAALTAVCGRDARQVPAVDVAIEGVCLLEHWAGIAGPDGLGRVVPHHATPYHA